MFIFYNKSITYFFIAVNGKIYHFTVIIPELFKGCNVLRQAVFVNRVQLALN